METRKRGPNAEIVLNDVTLKNFLETAAAPELAKRCRAHSPAVKTQSNCHKRLYLKIILASIQKFQSLDYCILVFIFRIDFIRKFRKNFDDYFISNKKMQIQSINTNTSIEITHNVLFA